jgi:hypothetical protein
VSRTNTDLHIDGFDFLIGSWTVRHRVRRGPLSGSTDWHEFTGVAAAQTLFDGGVSIDEISLTDGEKGMSVRLREPATRRWTIYWVNSRDGLLQAPVVGAWVDDVFDGYGEDELAGRAITAHYRWSHITPRSARWEQAFSVDDGRTWETNWIMDWTRRSTGRERSTAE